MRLIVTVAKQNPSLEYAHLAVRRHNRRCIWNLQQFHIFFPQTVPPCCQRPRGSAAIPPIVRGSCLSVLTLCAHKPGRWWLVAEACLLRTGPTLLALGSTAATPWESDGRCCLRFRCRSPCKEPCVWKGCLGSLEHWIGTCIFKPPELCENIDCY